MASALRIFRENEWYASGLALKVYINGVLAGNVSCNDYEDFAVEPDSTIEVQVKIDLLKSRLTRIDIPAEKLVIFKIGVPSISDFSSFLPPFDQKFLSLIPVSTDYRASKL